MTVAQKLRGTQNYLPYKVKAMIPSLLRGGWGLEPIMIGVWSPNRGGDEWCPQARDRKALSCAESMVWVQEEQPTGTAPGGPDSLAAFVQAAARALPEVCLQAERGSS